MRRLKVLIWHVHGGYLYYLTQAPHDFYLPSRPDRKGYYIGKWGHIPWGDNVHDVPVEEVKNLDLDCIIFQLPLQYLEDQYEILSAAQLKLPKIYIEHDPPQMHPTDTKHWVDNPNVLLVHVTAFNALMWNSGRTPTVVIDHGVKVPDGIEYKGELDKGIVIINHLKERGRRLGSDVYLKAQRELPLELVGMKSETLPGGLGEVLYRDLFEFQSHYRFLFNPIRYTSMGLAVCEAMMIGLPVIGLATTELVTVIKNGVNGFIDTNPDKLMEYSRFLLEHPHEARRLSKEARATAIERFSIDRFIRDWNKALANVTGLDSGIEVFKEVII